MRFTHYILTRFNCGLYTSNPYKIEDAEKWMNHRMEYFDACAESVKTQSCDKFTWVIFVDPQTPDKWKKEIWNMSNARVIDIKPIDYMKSQKINTPWLITTRLDCDDFYQPEFVQTIQDNFNAKEEVLDVVGMQFVESVGRYAKTGRTKPNSPFISLIERTKGFKTVLHETHSTMYQNTGGRFVGNKPLYVQVIHDRNLMNKSSGLWL